MKGWDQSHIERLKNRGMVVKDYTAPLPKNRVIHVSDINDFKASPKKKVLLEDKLQAQCITWFRSQYKHLYWRLYAIPNGGLRNKVIAVKLKRQGALSGVWDMFLSIPKNGHHGLYIELKVGYNKLTDNQNAFHYDNLNDYGFSVCRTLDEFIKAINDYLA